MYSKFKKGWTTAVMMKDFSGNFTLYSTVYLIILLDFGKASKEGQSLSLSTDAFQFW